jgi:hypothetical protein
MPKKTAAAASAASGSALTCGNAACRKALAPPLLRCGRCKAEAYCCKECQVLPPPRAAAREARLARLGSLARLAGLAGLAGLTRWARSARSLGSLGSLGSLAALAELAR